MQLSKRHWHLLALPSSSDFSEDTGVNISCGMVTSYSGQMGETNVVLAEVKVPKYWRHHNSH